MDWEKERDEFKKLMQQWESNTNRLEIVIDEIRRRIRLYGKIRDAVQDLVIEEKEKDKLC